MYTTAESPLFSFCGRHCEELGVAFLPSQYPFVPAQDIPTASIAGRHGTLRWKGRTFRPRYLKGTLYLLGEDDEPITTEELLRRGSELALWLCGQDGRGELILDALPDRYFIAEVDAEAALKDTDWLSGEAAISFTCQPFARSVREDTASADTETGTAKTIHISVSGNYETPLAFDVKNTSGSVMDTATIETASERFDFAGLAMDEGEMLSARYTQDDLLLITITGVDGAARSAMALRSTDSDDDLMLRPGRNAITVKTQRACSVRLSARGRWL